MRDPQCRLTFTANSVLRTLYEPLEPSHPIKSESGLNWAELKKIISYSWINETQLQSPKIPFVSSPDEWCDAQLYEAGLATLSLMEECNRVFYDLKDASAWNIIFNGCQPIFCDLTSFESKSSKAWWASGQFVRHFISPLLLSKLTGLKSSYLFKISRDGASPELVRSTLGWRRFFNRCWPLLISTKKNIQKSKNLEAPSDDEYCAYRKNLVASLRWMLESVKPTDQKSTPWASYTDDRGHYSKAASKDKHGQVLTWLQRIKPEWTLDLGCNTGEFTEIARTVGSSVIAIDGDHDAIQTLYRKHSGDAGVFPVLSMLDDLTYSRGWAGIEHKGLAQRLQQSADVVMMLALIHHLCIAAAVHLDQVALFAHGCTRRWLIIEWLKPSDSQVQLLCTQRRRKPDEFTVEAQRQAFINSGFTINEEILLSEGNRILALLEKN